MIAWLGGRCRSIGEDHVVVDVGGVGYLVHVPARETENVDIGEPVELQIHTVVREDSFSLYGFQTQAGREMFKTILSISGVGPKGALSLLSAMSPAEIARAIHDDKPRPLTAAKGIGKRTAELIVVRLRERLPAELLHDAMDHAPDTSATWTRAMSDAKSALVNLGFRATAADQAVLEASAGASDDFERLLRLALNLLRRPNA